MRRESTLLIISVPITDPNLSKVYYANFSSWLLSALGILHNVAIRFTPFPKTALIAGINFRKANVILP